jgi:signal transduction histidine kinase/ActR/RegA family two-component response regulator
LLTDDLEVSQSPLDSDRCEILADVNRACRTTVDILNDLLCFDKMESGILEVHKLMVPVEAFVTECVEMFSAQAREGNVALSVVTGDYGAMPLLEDDMVLIDRFKMDQVIRNLISNALKFTPPRGSVTVSVAFVPSSRTPPSPLERTRSSDCQKFHKVSLATVFRGMRTRVIPHLMSRRIRPEMDVERGESKSEHQQGDTSVVYGKLVIAVTDSGAGMREEEYSRLFKEIVQFRPEVLQAGGGSGLGLWITKGIVDLHGGTVSAHSAGLGQGSSFIVELSMHRIVNQLCPSTPATFTRLATPPIPVIDPDKIVRPACLPNKPLELGIWNLLIVDDSPLNRKMLLKTFRAAGHLCDYAEDGLIAVEMVTSRIASSEDSYSAILMDFVMPNMDGPTATKAIRGLGYEAPIFGLTGNTLSSDVEYFLASGADRVLAKPLNTDAFTLAMNELTRDQVNMSELT